MTGTLKLLIGPGPGAAIWSALHLLPLPAIWALRSWFRELQPGAGPQGGEAIFLFVVMLAMGATLIAWIDAIVVLGTAGIPGWRRFALWPLALLAVPLASGFFGMAMADAAGEADLSDSGRLRIAIGLGFILVLYYGCCFGALADVRAALQAARTTA
jgi:hypothetical protein